MDVGITSACVSVCYRIVGKTAVTCLLRDRLSTKKYFNFLEVALSRLLEIVSVT